MTTMTLSRLVFPGLCLAILPVFHATAQSRLAEQMPDFASLPDSSGDLQRQIDENGGILNLPPRVFRLTKTLQFDLARHGMAAARAENGTATLIMDGPGPAVRFQGTHEGSADPKAFKAATWNERMPIVEGLVIVGNHPEADGVELVQTVQPVVHQVSVRWARHGIHLAVRNRNVIVSDCQIYENSGCGVFYDDVNLHQSNISNSHISYNRAGGVVIRGGNVRNVQIAGCDLEANMPGEAEPVGGEPVTRAANILIDVSETPDDKSRSVAEVAITGCTIQHSANYSGGEDQTVAPGGANIRLLGKEVWPIDSVAITGNVVSDTTTNFHLDHCMDITISGNTFFAPKPENLVVTNSTRVIVSGNTFNPRQFERPGLIRFADSTDCVISGATLHSHLAGGGLLLENCSGFLIDGVRLTDCAAGIVLKNVRDTTLSHCRASGSPEGTVELSIDGESRGILLDGNRFPGKTEVDPAALDTGE